MDAATQPQKNQKPRKLTRRGADARGRIIAAMIACIGRAGYGATTVEHVMTEAGLSRGSVLHQFPTRLELTIATAEHAMKALLAGTHERAARLDDPFARIAGYAEILWDMHREPEGVAITDILLATRWDTELAAALQPITGQIEREVHGELLTLARDAGLFEPERFVPHGWLLLASVRGLIIEHTLGPARPMILDAIATMKHEHRRLCERLRAPPQK